MEGKKTFRIIRAVLLVGFVIAFLTIILCILSTEYKSTKTYDIENGWTISDNTGKIYHDVLLSKFNLSGVYKQGDTIVMSRSVPSDVHIQTTLRVYTRLSTIKVYLDDQCIYQYGQKEWKNNQLIGSGYHFVQLPMTASGKMLRVELTATERGAIKNLPTMTLTSSSVAIRYFSQNHSIGIFISFFLTILGIMLLLLSFMFIPLHHDYIQLTVVGAFCMIMGGWSMCNLKSMELFSTSLSINSFLEYIFLYAAPIPFFILLKLMRTGLIKHERILCNVLIGISSVFFLLSLLLEITGIVDLPELLELFHILIVAEIFVALFGSRRSFTSKDSAEKLFFYGVIFVFIIGVLEVIRYDLQLVFPKIFILQTSYLSIAVLCFSWIVFICYLLRVYQRVISEKEVEVLSNLASVDVLTGLYNRTECNKVFLSLKEKKGMYAFIYLDLNELKVVNDTYGHEQGDLLITTFADILTQCFSDVGRCFRMGGDEFLVILEDMDENLVRTRIERMCDMKKEISKEVVFNIDASYGVAYSTEISENNPEKLNRMADERMYHMKETSKKGRI